MTLIKLKLEILLVLFVNCAIALECSDGENCILHKQQNQNGKKVDLLNIFRIKFLPLLHKENM